MFYYKLVFACAYLPLAILFYQLAGKKLRWIVLLLASLGFYASFSVSRLIYPFGAAAIAYFTGMCLDALLKKQDAQLSSVTGEKDEVRAKKNEIRGIYTKKLRAVLALGIVVLLLIILNNKYTDFAIENVNAVLRMIGVDRQFSLRNSILPLGISFYTLQAIGYLVDIYWRKIPAQKNPFKLLLFIMFFPTITEGPITPYSSIYKSLYEGEPIDPDNVMAGYFRLGWGTMKKLVIADRLYPVVCWLYYKPNEICGLQVIMAAVLFTVMEYMDFSGCIDMALGIGQIFGLKLPENFRQPFLAKNASQFWRRWHISLGVWFKTYIFYPMSMSTLARKWGKTAKGRFSANTIKAVSSAIALLPVWLCNGLWHGPKWTYIFYGVFYFAVIMLEIILEPGFDRVLAALKLEKESRGVTVFRVLKTWIVIFTGELFFEAASLSDGFKLLHDMFKNFRISILWDGSMLEWGMDAADWIIVIAFLIIVGIVNMLREKGTDVCQKILSGPAAIRWGLGVALIVSILILGLYGPGFLEVNTIYAGF